MKPSSQVKDILAAGENTMQMLFTPASVRLGGKILPARIALDQSTAEYDDRTTKRRHVRRVTLSVVKAHYPPTPYIGQEIILGKDKLRIERVAGAEDSAPAWTIEASNDNE